MKLRVRVLLAVGIALVLVVNAIVLAGVAWNRSGEPEAMMRLSERELRLPPAWQDMHEDSGIALSLAWRVPVGSDDESTRMYAYGQHRSVDWLDADRLAALGFDLSESPDVDSRRRYRRIARELWLALELDGPAHARSVQRVQDEMAEAERSLAEYPGSRDSQERVDGARQTLLDAKDTWSRLIAIDADLDPDVLRSRHPDRQRVAVVLGRIRPTWNFPNAEIGRHGEWRGYIEALSIDSIHVPLALRASFESFIARRDAERGSRYEVTVAYGRRKEPWIVEVHTQEP